MNKNQLDRNEYENKIFVILRDMTLADEDASEQKFTANVKDGTVMVTAECGKFTIIFTPSDENKEPETYVNRITMSLRQLANLQMDISTVKYSKKTLKYHKLQNTKP